MRLARWHVQGWTQLVSLSVAMCCGRPTGKADAVTVTSLDLTERRD